MVSNTLPPPYVAASLVTRSITRWKCKCGAEGEFYNDTTSVEDEEVEHLLKTGCGLSLTEIGSREVEEKRQPPSLPPIPARLVTGC